MAAEMKLNAFIPQEILDRIKDVENKMKQIQELARGLEKDYNIQLKIDVEPGLDEIIEILLKHHV